MLAFVALDIPFDSFRGLQEQTCSPFLCGLEAPTAFRLEKARVGKQLIEEREGRKK
jgi:hypothetical protein